MTARSPTMSTQGHSPKTPENRHSSARVGRNEAETGPEHRHFLPQFLRRLGCGV